MLNQYIKEDSAFHCVPENKATSDMDTHKTMEKIQVSLLKGVFENQEESNLQLVTAGDQGNVEHRYTVKYEDSATDEESGDKTKEDNDENDEEEQWICCDPRPYQTPSQKNTKQYTFGEHIYNHHESSSRHALYYCKYAHSGTFKCKARLKYSKESDKWFYLRGHNHPAPKLLKEKKRNLPKLDELLASRQEELKNFLLEHRRIRSVKSICSSLNSNINKDDMKLFIFPSQVQEAKSKFVYTASIKDWEDLYVREELRQTHHHQEFLRTLHLYPEFIIQFAADWQIDILKTVTAKDQLFIDGTFDICPEGMQQMVTLLIKRQAWSFALPVVHSLLRRKTESAYVHMLNHIVRLAPEITSVENLLISVDFEQALHNALHIVLSKAKIVGCEFHMKQSIFRYIAKGNAGKIVKNDMDDIMNRKDLNERLTVLIHCPNEQQFTEERLNFINYYKLKIGYSKFVEYMQNNWLGTANRTAKFPSSIWSLYQMPRQDIKLTNNLLENFHKEINSRFSSKPQLKKTIQLLQEIEEDSFSKKKQCESHVSVSTTELVAPSSQSISASKKSRPKSQKTVEPANKRPKAIEYNANTSLPQLPSTQTTSTQAPANTYAIQLPQFNINYPAVFHMPLFNPFQNSNGNQNIFYQYPMPFLNQQANLGFGSSSSSNQGSDASNNGSK